MNEIANHQSQVYGREPTPGGHSLRAVDRREILVSGVREVLSFDESNVRLVTSAGILNVEGRELRIPNLNTGEGVVAVTGILDGVLYESDTADDPVVPAKKGLLGRLR